MSPERHPTAAELLAEFKDSHHTPGEWYTYDGSLIRQHDKDGVPIATIRSSAFGHGSDSPTGRAAADNAHLIRRAPVLLAALSASEAKVKALREAMTVINNEATEALNRGKSGDTGAFPQPINYICLIANKARVALAATAPDAARGKTEVKP